jgi:hypothetical protein
MTTTHKTLVACTILLGALAIAAESKPNFTGTWELNIKKIRLRGAPITKLVVEVAHKDPAYVSTSSTMARIARNG